jgi:uncharacterized LabA/DUF88 family protein
MRQNSVAILIDGGFFLKRYYSLLDKQKLHTAEHVAKDIFTSAKKHLRKEDNLYRIFYYDCMPFSKRVHHPVSKKVIDFRKTPQYQFRIQLFEELKKKRKMALRLGTLKDSKNWALRSGVAKELLEGKKTLADLTESDVHYELRQKGIDMKIGVDIASLAFKKFVDRIILISGDGDFVPASKLARKEGIDFIPDPMWNPIDDSLSEHIDGLHSTCPKPPYLRKIPKSPESHNPT